MYRTLIALGITTNTIYAVDLATGSVEPVHADAGPTPDGVVVSDGVVYWTTMGAPTVREGLVGEAALDFTARTGGVHSVALDGASPVGRAVRDITRPGDITTGKQLALADGWLYWGDREGGRVSRIRLDGSGLEDLVVNAPGIDGECVGVAVDTARGEFYWTQKGPAKGGTGRILRAPLALRPGETPQTRTDVETLWDHLPEPIDLEIEGETLYWTDRGAAPLGNTVNRAPLPAPGERGQTPQILADGFQEAIGLAVDSDARVVYVADLAGRILRVPLTGSHVELPRRAELVADLGTPVSGIAGIGSL
jgi:sugar lactone lactonase YvrE